MKKQLKDLTDDEVDEILTIMLGKPQYNVLVNRVGDDYIVAEYARKRPLPNRTDIDYVRMYITIDDQFQIYNRWGYVNETPSKGCLGESISSEPLYNYQYIARYLEQRGYDIYQKDNENRQ